MKKFNSISIASIACVCTMLFFTTSCAKQETAEPCHTCTARMDGSVISQTEACSTEAENAFKASHPYATVSCQ